MNELSTRLDYLEQIGSEGFSEEHKLDNPYENEPGLLEQAEKVGERLSDLLKKNEEDDVLKNIEANAIAAATIGGPQNGTNRSVPLNVQREAILARSNELSKLVSSLGATQLQIPSPLPKPPIEATRRLVARAAALGDEFDRLTICSTELITNLLQQIARENEEVSHAS